MRRMLTDLAKSLPVFMGGRAPATVTKTSASVLGLVAVVGNVRVADVNRGHLMAYRTARLVEVAPATVAKDLRQIKSALSYAADAEWIKTNPAWRWRGMTLVIPEKEIRIVEESEFSTIEHAAGLEFAAYLGLCFWQGLRRKEACQIRWPQIRFQPNVVVVLNLPKAGELTKTRRNRKVPLRKSARTLLWRLRQTKLALGHKCTTHVFANNKGGHWHPDTVGGRFTRLVQQVGVARCTLHDLRRSFSTLAQRRGVDVPTIMRLGGWSSAAVVAAHYTGDLHGHLAATMARLDAMQGDEDYATDFTSTNENAA